MTLHEQKSSYDFDLYQWSMDQAFLLRNRKLSEIDFENIAEEIESLGRKDKRTLRSQLERLIQHLLKEKYTPERKGNSKSWDASIRDSRKDIDMTIKDSPSLKNELKNIFEESFIYGRELAIRDTEYSEHLFPKKCPWTIEEILGE